MKRGTKLSDTEEIYGYGPYSEKYSYELSKLICKNPVEYDVMRYHRKIASRCKSFCDENISYVPIAYILGGNARFSQCLDYYKSIGFEEQFKEMMVLDSLICNEDRHLKNFGVLYDADSLKVIGMAPVFDNNLGLFPNNRTEEMKNLDRFLINRTSAFGIDFDDLSHKCMTSDIKRKLINLQGFKFSRDGKYSLDEERIDALNRIVEYRLDVAIDRKVFFVENKEDYNINVDDIRLVFDSKAMNEEAADIIKSDSFLIPDFDVRTASDSILHIYDCEHEVYEFGDDLEVDIYDSKVSGESESLEIKDFLNFRMISEDMSKEIRIRPREVCFQISDGRRIIQSFLNDVDIPVFNEADLKKNEASDRKAVSNKAKINAVLSKGEAMESAFQNQNDGSEISF